jgi:hypothetical protein
MRTTLTLADDVASELQRLQKERGSSFKTLVNEALREGLIQLEHPHPARTFKTETLSLGRCLLGDLNDISEVLAAGEGEVCA